MLQDGPSGKEHLLAALNAVDPLYSRDGKHVLMPADACQAFVDYLTELPEDQLVRTLADKEFLCMRDNPPWEQFEWKRDRCREELERRGGSK